jgi:5-methylcytosine-specific restriction endonuclease McrA
MGAEREPYSRWRIFERDNWCCQLCGDPVERDAYYKDRTVATIDHITPMGRGGADAPRNLQTAHRICNLERNASDQANV